MNYEEQERVLQEIKRRPDVKRLRTLSIVFNVLGVVLIIGPGLGFLIAADVLSKKYQNRINACLTSEVSKRDKEEVEAAKLEQQRTSSFAEFEVSQMVTAPQVSVEAAKIDETAAAEKAAAEKAETRERVERLVRVSNKVVQRTFFLFGVIMIAAVMLLLLPIGQGLGIVDISLLDVLKDLFKNAQDNISDLPWVFISAILFAGVCIILLVCMFVFLIYWLTRSKTEIIIRESKGRVHVPLTAQEIKNGKEATKWWNVFSAILSSWGMLLAFPITFLVKTWPLVSVDLFTAFNIVSLFVGDLALAIICSVFLVKNKKDIELFANIKYSYKRYKIYKLKQELE